MTQKELKTEALRKLIGKIVLCSDNFERLVLEVDEEHVVYALEISNGTWMRLSPTHRAYIARDLIEGKIVGDANDVKMHA